MILSLSLMIGHKYYAHGRELEELMNALSVDIKINERSWKCSLLGLAISLTIVFSVNYSLELCNVVTLFGSRSNE